MKMAHQILIILILVSNLSASYKMTIQELLAVASSNLDIPIVLSENLDSSSYIYYDDVLTVSNVNNILSSLLLENGYKLKKNKNIYYVKKIKDKEVKIFERKIKIKYLTEKDISKILSFYKQKYLYVNNTIYLKANNNIYLPLKFAIDSLDTPPLQRKIKITIVETNLNKLKELGSKVSLKRFSNNIFNIGIGNFNAITSLDEINQFSLDFSYLLDNGVSKIVTSPILSLRDLKNTNFDITKTIPVKKSTQTISDTKSTSIQNIDYKSYGIKINLFSRIFDDHIDLDIDMILQDIISSTNNMPSTSDKKIKESILLKNDEIYMLSGFNKHLTTTNTVGVPILQDIPLLGYFFKWKSDSDSDVVLSMLIQIVN